MSGAALEEMQIQGQDLYDRVEDAFERGDPGVLRQMWWQGEFAADDDPRWEIWTTSAWYRWGPDLFRSAWGDVWRSFRCRPPAEPVRLWRGATPENRASWSWTSQRDVAVVFSSGFSWTQPEVGMVWTAVVPPRNVLMRLDAHDEWIVDPAGLEIQPDGLWCRCSVDLSPFRTNARVALDLHEVIHCPRL